MLIRLIVLIRAPRTQLISCLLERKCGLSCSDKKLQCCDVLFADVLVCAVTGVRMSNVASCQRQTSTELSRQQSDTTSCDTVSMPDMPCSPYSDGTS